MRHLMLAIAVLAIAVGCTAPVKIESIPSGADVYYDGQLVGQTPTVVHLPTSRTTVILRLEKPGYVTTQPTVNARYNAWSGNFRWPNMELYRLQKDPQAQEAGKADK